MVKDEKSLGSGLIFIGLGGGLILYSLATLDTGTGLRMGPGYFPVAIGACLVTIGAAVLFSMRGLTRIAARAWPWREILMILGGILIFAFGLKYLGFWAASFLMVFITARARRETGTLQAAVIAVAITFFSTAVFVWGLGIPFRLY